MSRDAKRKEIDSEKAIKLLERLRESIKKHGWKLKGTTEDEIIEELRQTRHRLWEKKIGSSARRK